MARIQGVPDKQAGPIVKLVYRLMRRGVKKMTGREAAHGDGIEPIAIWAHQPKMMRGMGMPNSQSNPARAISASYVSSIM